MELRVNTALPWKEELLKYHCELLRELQQHSERCASHACEQQAVSSARGGGHNFTGKISSYTKYKGFFFSLNSIRLWHFGHDKRTGSAILFRVHSDVCTPGVLLLLLVLKLVHYSNSIDNQQSISIYKVLPFSFFFSFVTCEAVFVINDSKLGHLIKF